MLLISHHLLAASTHSLGGDERLLRSLESFSAVRDL